MTSVSDEVVDVADDSASVTHAAELTDDVFGDPETVDTIPEVKPEKAVAKRRAGAKAKATSATEPKAKRSKKVTVAAAEEGVAASAVDTQLEEASAAASSAAVAPPMPQAEKVDRRRGKITDPVKLAARREQLAKMREKALAARSANAKRARALKEAADWKKKQDEERLLSEYSKRTGTQSDSSLGTFQKSEIKEQHATMASESSLTTSSTPTMATPPSLPHVEPASVAANASAATAATPAEASPFGGYYTKATGWNVNPLGTPVTRFANAYY